MSQELSYTHKRRSAFVDKRLSLQTALLMTGCLRSLTFAAGLLLATASPSPAQGAEDRFDVLFFASEGPVLLRVVLDTSRVNIAAVRERFVSVLMDAFDTDQDGLLSPEEAAQVTWDGLESDPEEGSLTPEELAAKVESTFGPRFVVRRKAPLLVQSVQLHSRLDGDNDRQISREEIQQGVAALRQYDFDDDGTYSPAELQPFPQSMLDAAMNPDAGGDDRDFIVLNEIVLNESEPLEPLADRLMATYRQPEATGLALSDLQISELAFRSLDANSDAALDREELVGLLERPRPHAEIHVNFRRRRVTLKASPWGAARVGEEESSSKSRLTVRLGGETVEFSSADNRYQAGDQISFLRIEFRRQDGDKNGYLGPEEFAMLGDIGAAFEEVDLDNDGQVFLEELDRIVRLDAYHSQSFAEMTVDAIDKPLFQILDENVDRRLTPKEFASGIERMQPYDRDGDGTLDAAELLALRRYRVAFSFGVPPRLRIDRQSQMTADRRMPVVRAMTSGPEWFRKTDRNQDGDVTWREFLGPRAAFNRLDRDGSGWIDAAEAAEENVLDVKSSGFKPLPGN